MNRHLSPTLGRVSLALFFAILLLATFPLMPGIHADAMAAKDAAPQASSASTGTQRPENVDKASSSSDKDKKKSPSKDKDKKSPAASDEEKASSDKAATQNGSAPEESEDGSAEQKQADVKSLEQMNAEAEQAARLKEAEQKRLEAEELAKNDPWNEVWANQRAMIDNIVQDAQAVSQSFIAEASIIGQIQPVEEDVHKLLTMYNNLKRWPNPLEAVGRKLSISAEVTESILQAASAGKDRAERLFNRLTSVIDNLPDNIRTDTPEMQEYVTQVSRAYFLLTSIIARYASAVAPAKALLEQINGLRKQIDDQLPGLWDSYYLQSPVPWLSFETWSKLPKAWWYFQQGLSLRRPVELPLTNSHWQTAIFRFMSTFILLTLLTLVIARRFLRDYPDSSRRILQWSMPWNIIGIALFASSVAANLDVHRLPLALGNLSLIMGQIFLAWDIRRMKFPEVTVTASPLWKIVPLIMCAYTLLYISPPTVLCVALWILCILGDLFLRRYRKPQDLGSMQVENVILDLEPLVLWPCLLLALAGLHIYSMVLYLLYSSLSIATQLSLASMWFVSNVNSKLPKEGVKSIVASFIIALSAPLLLVMTLGAVSMWLLTLPGGLYILQGHIFSDVSIGSTQLNLIQCLLIVTAFFLARTAASMGKLSIGKLPQQGVKLDPTLVQPLQTAFNYAVWGLFGLFTLRALGMDLSNLAVVAGGLSVGIGFGMQNIVNNFFSGLILIFSRSLQVGDVVQVDGVLGHVKQITVRATVVETYDSAVIYVPNATLVSARLTNWTRNSPSARFSLVVGVAYGTDTAKVSKLLVSIAEKNSNILAVPKPDVLFDEFNSSTLDFKLRYWVKDYDLAGTTTSQLRYAIESKFAAEGIEIAFPQMDLHVKDMPRGGVKRQAPRDAKALPAKSLRRIRRPSARTSSKPSHEVITL